MNLGIFTGRLGRDAELNHMPSGDPVLNFRMAVDVGTREKPNTMWVECALYGQRTHKMQQHLTTGIKVTVSGRITMETFATKDGAQKSALRLTVGEIDISFPPKGDGQQTQQTQRTSNAGHADDMDDPIPF